MFAAQRLGVVTLVLRWLDQRPQAHPNALHITSLRGACQVAGRLLQDEINFRLKGQRLRGQIVTRRVGGAQNHLPQPRHGKQHAAIGGFGHHQGRLPRQKPLVHHHVHALARRHHGLCAAVLFAQGIDPHPCGVDHAPRCNLVALPRQSVHAMHPRHLAVGVAQALDPQAVEQQSPLQRRAACQGQRQLGVIELAIPIHHTAAQTLRLHRGQTGQSLPARQKLGSPQARRARQSVVQLQTHAIKRLFPPRIRGHHKGQGLGDVRCVVQQCAALVQRFAHQGNVALRQIPHAPVHQLGRTRRGAFGKIVRLQQHHAVATRRGIQSQTQTRGPAAHNGQVINSALVQEGHQVGTACGQR